MSVLDAICGLIAPHLCVGCRREGTLLCPECRVGLIPPESTCFNCKTPTENYKSCDDCFRGTGLRAVYTVTSYDDIAKELVWRLKFTGARAAATVMAQAMAATYAPPCGTVVVPVPTATGRVRQRGYDQAVVLAKAYAEFTKKDYQHCLRRLGQKRQRGADRDDRKRQLKGMYRLVNNKKLLNARILLIDDVSTTGATLEAAATILLESGAQSVEAIVFAKA